MPVKSGQDDDQSHTTHSLMGLASSISIPIPPIQSPLLFSSSVALPPETAALPLPAATRFPIPGASRLANKSTSSMNNNTSSSSSSPSNSISGIIDHQQLQQQQLLHSSQRHASLFSAFAPPAPKQIVRSPLPLPPPPSSSSSFFSLFH